MTRSSQLDHSEHFSLGAAVGEGEGWLVK